MKKRKKSSTLLKDKSIRIFIRYLIILALMFSLPLIYAVLTPTTIYSSAGLLALLYDIEVRGSIILMGQELGVEIIPACVAGSAYLLLLILNLSVPMSLKKRAYSLLLSFIILFTLNILRIFLLAILYHKEIPFFDFTHKLFWYVLSTIFVVAIWFLIVKIFSIKEIPVYNDLKFFIKRIK